MHNVEFDTSYEMFYLVCHLVEKKYMFDYQSEISNPAKKQQQLALVYVFIF